MINGKQKGSRSERQVAKLLETWWGRRNPSVSVVRTPQSGGFSTPKVRGELRMSGDISTTDVKFPWVVEVKNRQAWSLERVVQGLSSPMWGWWGQALREAAEQRLEPSLWVKKNRTPWYVVFRREYMTWAELMSCWQWEGQDLSNVLLGCDFPIAFEAERLLSLHPKMF